MVQEETSGIEVSAALKTTQLVKKTQSLSCYEEKTYFFFIIVREGLRGGRNTKEGNTKEDGDVGKANE